MPVRERIDGASIDTKANVYFEGYVCHFG